VKYSAWKGAVFFISRHMEEPKTVFFNVWGAIFSVIICKTAKFDLLYKIYQKSLYE